MDSKKLKAIAGNILSFNNDPAASKAEKIALGKQAASKDSAYCYIPEGLVVMEQGRIVDMGPEKEVRERYPELDAGCIDRYPQGIIMPGFIDCHCHYVQTPMVGSFGDTLLNWLNTYTFPTEARFASEDFSREVARMFFRQTLAAGTTTSNIFSTTFPCSVEALFEESERLGARNITGKVLQDRNLPDNLRDSDAEESVSQSEDLLRKWHGRGRQLYAVIPRFAPTSTPEQMRLAGQLYQQHRREGVYLHTHLNEAENEIQWAMSLYPEARDYIDIYDRYAMVDDRSVFAHCCIMQPQEWERMHLAGSAAVHCPTSNLFLGDGQFRILQALDPARPCLVGMGTDIGGGTSFSIVRTLGEAYKVGMLHEAPVNALRYFYLATLGGARALHLDHLIGRIAPGYEADMVVLDTAATEYLQWRLDFCNTLEEKLFAILTVAPDRIVAATFIAGECRSTRQG